MPKIAAATDSAAVRIHTSKDEQCNVITAINGMTIAVALLPVTDTS